MHPYEEEDTCMAIATMVEALQESAIKDEEDEFQLSKFKEEYEKIYRDAVEYTDPIVKALNGLPALSYQKWPSVR